MVKELRFILSHITCGNNFAAVKIDEAWKKEFESPQRSGMWFAMNNINSHSIQSELVMFINIRVLRLQGSTEWKSSFGLAPYVQHNKCIER